MDKNINSLSPQEVWQHFTTICSIPHPSCQEHELVGYITDIATQHKLEYKQDNAGNLLVSKPASAGMEGRKTIVLQAHLDMVSEKVADKDFDFTKDPIEAFIEGGWVKANGTALGADNAVGVAAILAILESDKITHGPINALFTVSQEIGMLGAFGLENGFVDGDILINLDSEEEGSLCVGCAGGVEYTATFKYVQDSNVYNNRAAIKFDVSGLQGGHSGYDVGAQRANANKVLFRLLCLGIKYFDLHLGYVDGGCDVCNAIPREATAVVCCPEKDAEDLLYGVGQFEDIIREEYKDIETGISIKAYRCKMPEIMWDMKSTNNVINAICACPNGVTKMSPRMQGLVETSSNLAGIYSHDGKVVVKGLVRSFSDTEKEALANDITAVFDLAGAKVQLDGAYNGWKPNMDSDILRTMKNCYVELFDKQPKVMALHAGLETGIIAGVVNKMDFISCGPTIKNVHSPNEKVNIDSVEKFWKLLCHTLANAPVK